MTLILIMVGFYHPLAFNSSKLRTKTKQIEAIDR